MSPRRATRALSLGALSYFFAAGLGIPTLPRLVTGPLDGTLATAGLAIGILSVAAVAFRPALPRLARRFRPGGLMTVGASAAAVSVLGLLWAPSIPVVFALRVLAGVAEALVFVTATVAVARLADDGAGARSQYELSVSVYGGLLLGAPVAEALRPLIGLDGIWLLAGAACVAAGVLTSRVPLGPEAPRSGGRSGAVRAVVVPAFALAAVTFGVLAFQGFVALYSEKRLGHGATAPFVAFGAVVLSVRILGARRLADASPRRVAGAAALTSAAALGVVAWWPTDAGLLLGAATLGVGEAVAYPALLALALTAAGAADRTAAVAAFTGALDAALALGAPLFGALVGLAGFQRSFTVAALVCAGGAGVLMLGSRSKKGWSLARG